MEKLAFNKVAQEEPLAYGGTLSLIIFKITYEEPMATDPNKGTLPDRKQRKPQHP